VAKSGADVTPADAPPKETGEVRAVCVVMTSAVCVRAVSHDVMGCNVCQVLKELADGSREIEIELGDMATYGRARGDCAK
jgi:hypothetical protein